MKNTRITYLICFLLLSVAGFGQRSVFKTYDKPVYMHYMPWFESIKIDGSWGYHWTMNDTDPNQTLVDGGQYIASHFHPSTGAYSTRDPFIQEYQLLLMKYSGIDGIIVDWYGQQGTNGDIGKLLVASNSIIDRTPEFGLEFSVMLEDRFAANESQVEANLRYCRDNYFDRENYSRIWGKPLLTIFGPNKIFSHFTWTEILPATGQDVHFMQYQGNAGMAGLNSGGEFAWINAYDDHLQTLELFYDGFYGEHRVLMAAAYPGFLDYYEEAGGQGYPDIPHNGTATLKQTLDLVTQYDATIDALQLATWNDYGEGTMFEPTLEFGYDFLRHMQFYLGVEHGVEELKQISRLYDARVQLENDSYKQTILDQASEAFSHNEPEIARGLIDVALWGNTSTAHWVNRHSWDFLSIDQGALKTTQSSSGTNWTMVSATDSTYFLLATTPDSLWLSVDMSNQLQLTDSTEGLTQWVREVNGDSYMTWRLATDHTLVLVQDSASGMVVVQASAVDSEMAQWATVYPTSTEGTKILWNDMRLYPNPFQDQLEIRAGTSIEFLELLTVTGQLVMQMDFESPTKQIQLNSAGLDAGVYVVRLYTSNKKMATHRLVKN